MLQKYILSLYLQLCCINNLKIMRQSRNTVAKTKVLELLSHSEVALSHTEIESEIEIPVNRVTIYRILDRLIDEGIIHKIVNTDGAMKYALCHNCTMTHHHNHVHFSCQKCKAVTCLEGVEPTFKLPSDYKIQEVNFTVSGLCPNCL